MASETLLIRLIEVARPNTTYICEKVAEVVLLTACNTLQNSVPRSGPKSWLLKLFPSAAVVQIAWELVRLKWFKLNCFGTLALVCPIANRYWAYQASGTPNPKKLEQ